MVMWLGLILIGLNVILNWQEFKSVVFAPATAALLSATPQSKPLSTGTTPTPTPTPPNVQATLWLLSRPVTT